MNFLRALLLILFVVATAYSETQWEPTWGSEMTFTSDAQVASTEHGPGGGKPYSSENQAALEKSFAAVKKHLRGRNDVQQVRYHNSEVDQGDKWFNDYFEVIYKDGFRVKFTMDPFCIEVIPSPFTLKQFRSSLKDRIQNDVFDVMTSNGFVVRHKDFQGGGHLNMGAESTFGNDVPLFRNWLVDQINHSELANGAMEKDLDNAKPYTKLKASQRREFVKLIEAADAGKFKTPRDLANAFVEKVLFEDKPATGERITAYKYWMMIMLRFADLDTWNTYGAKPRSKWNWKDYEAWIMYDDENVPTKARVVEVRHLKAQENADQILKDIELFEGRLRYLKSRGPIPISQNFIDGKEPNAHDGALAFAKYIREAGQNPEDYFSRLPQNRKESREWQTWQRTFANSCRASLAKLREKAKVPTAGE